MQKITDSDSYVSPPRKLTWLQRNFPSYSFYWRMFLAVLWSYWQAKRGRYDEERWGQSSRMMLRAMEAAGIEFEIENYAAIASLPQPCVFVANHMSTLETFVLPYLLLPFNRVAYVVKKSLVEYPIFKDVLLARDPIVVGRTNPREDLKTVLEQGAAKLQHGVSIIVFPQTTRCVEFIPEEFNSIGVKLAKKAGVPIVPIALKTDAWSNGRKFKDFGPIMPEKKAHIVFGRSLAITENGRLQHKQAIDFIAENLAHWQKQEENQK